MNRVKEVKALPNYRLAGIWEDGVFDRVVADHGTVMRPNGADLCPDEIYDNSVRD